MPQVKILDPEQVIVQPEFVGTFRVDIDTHIFEDRQRLRQHERFVIAVDNEVHVPGRAADRPVQVDRAR